MTVDDKFIVPLRDGLTRLGLAANAKQLTALARHFDLLVEANTRFNLTRITEPSTAAVRLYADSAAVLAWARCRSSRVETVLDVGTGAGFPAVPLAVLSQDWRVTAMEATSKKAAFVEQCARRLRIDNLSVIQAHSDHWDKKAVFDLVTLKAVGGLATCIKTVRRFVARGGYVALFKTARLGADELDAARSAANAAGMTELPPFEYELPTAEGLVKYSLRIYKK